MMISNNDDEMIYKGMNHEWISFAPVTTRKYHCSLQVMEIGNLSQEHFNGN